MELLTKRLENIMLIVWSYAEKNVACTADIVWKELSNKGTNVQYRTVNAELNFLHGKGFIVKKPSNVPTNGRFILEYLPAVSQTEYMQTSNRYYLERFYESASQMALDRFVQDAKVQ